MTFWKGHEWPGMKVLRCDLCGDQIGVYGGEKPDPQIVVARCYACAAVEEAEKITGEAV